MKIRLKQNVIIGKEFIARGTVVDSDILPEHLQTPEMMDADTSFTQGRVLLLTDFQYSSAASGTTTHYPVALEAGETIALEDIPERHREGLIEGENYLVQWTERDRARVKAQKVKEYNDFLFGPSPVGDVHVGPGGW